MIRPDPMPSLPIGAKPYFKDVCKHVYKHIDTSKFKVSGEDRRLKWKVVDRFFCERCLKPETKISFHEIGEFR